MASETEHLLESEGGKLHTQDKSWRINNSIGIIIVFIICMCDIGSIACLQLISNLPPDFELNALRFTSGLIFSMGYIFWKRKLPKIQKKLSGWVFLVALSTYLYNISLFNGYVKELPVGAIIGLKQGFFIVLIAIASHILLQEKHSWIHSFLALATFSGVVLVILSSFLQTGVKDSLDLKNSADSIIGVANNEIRSTQNIHHNNSKQRSDNQSDIMHFSSGWTQNKTQNHERNHKMFVYHILISISLIFCCALFGTIENFAISQTGLREENYSLLSFWYFLFGSISSLITSLIFEDIFIPHILIDQVLCLVHSILASTGTFLLIVAYKLMNPNLLSVVFSIQIPLALLTQIYILESVTPPVELWMFTSGLGIITLSVLSISVKAICYH